MIPADTLSRRHDHIGDEEAEDIIGLPEELWIGLLDIELQDTITAGLTYLLRKYLLDSKTPTLNQQNGP